MNTNGRQPSNQALSHPEPSQVSPVSIRVAAIADTEQVARLFDLYRQFYDQPSDEMLARAFVLERMTKGDSAILVASRATSELVGFVQLYPTYCSVSAARIFVLYDLFISPKSRRKGTGTALLDAAAKYAAQAKAVRLELATAKTNLAAQRLYESLGWVRDDVFYRYTLPIAL